MSPKIKEEQNQDVGAGVLQKLNQLGQVKAAFWVTHLILDFQRLGIESPVEQLFFAWWKYLRADKHHELLPQFQIGKYFVDFLIDGTKIVVEIDGYWHEKTKEQVKKDRQRERAIEREGFHVVRFTGSEVYHEPQRCIGETIQMILQWSEGEKS